MRVINVTKNTILAEQARMADSFFSRLVGLLNRSSLLKGEALILAPSNSIHSFFMRFTIDAAFVDKHGKVMAVLHSFKPFRLSPIYFGSCLTIELPEGTLKQTQTQPGDALQIR